MPGGVKIPINCTLNYNYILDIGLNAFSMPNRKYKNIYMSSCNAFFQNTFIHFWGLGKRPVYI